MPQPLQKTWATRAIPASGPAFGLTGFPAFRSLIHSLRQTSVRCITLRTDGTVGTMAVPPQGGGLAEGTRMRINGLTGGHLFTISLMTAATGSVQPAHANCLQDPLIASSHVCSGVSVLPGSISFGGTDISVMVAAPSVFFNVAGATDQLSITGDGALAFRSEGSVLLLSGGAVGVNLLNSGIGSAGSIAITTVAADPASPGPWRIEGATAGIQAINRANGDITLTLGSRIVGTDAGVVAQQDGAGSIDLAARGWIGATGGSAVSLSAGTAGAAIAVSLRDATADGQSDGLDIRNAGSGGVTLFSMETTITGQTGNGIGVSDLGAGSIEITTEESDDAGLAAQGALHGIRAENGGEGSVRLSINKGDILGQTGDGISVLNDTGSADVVLRLSGPASAQGGASGIDIRNLGTGGTTIDAGEATDRISGAAGDGLRAANGGAASTGIIITTGSGDGIDAVSGGLSGIAASNAGGAEIWIQTGSGAITGRAGSGLRASNGPRGTDITILAGTGKVSGSDAGIDVDNDGTGNLTITALGEVTGAGGAGITATNGAVAQDVASEDATVQGGDLILATHALVHGVGGAGIVATNSGLGQLSITSNAEVRGDSGSGILALNGARPDGAVLGTDLAVESFGLVSGTLRGIDAGNTGSGSLTITAWADVTGEAGDGIRARSGLADAATASGGALTISTFGQILGQGGAGIRTRRSGDPSLATSITISMGSAVRGLTAALIAEAGDGQLISISNAGDLRNLGETDGSLVVQTDGGRTDLTNDGRMTGRIVFGTFDDVLTNTGMWSFGGTSDFGTGHDALTNSGSLIAANAAGQAECTVLAGLDDLANAGLIDLSDAITGDVPLGFDSLEIAGNFDGSGGFLRLDAILGGPGALADRLVIGGTVTGRTGIVINALDDGLPSVGSSLLLVDTGGSTGTEFVLAAGPILRGSQVYDLFWDGEDFFLQSALAVLRLDPAALPAILGGLWDIGASGWHRNTRQDPGPPGAASGLSRSSKGIGSAAGSVVRGWATLVLDDRSEDGWVSPQTGTAQPPTGVGFHQTTQALLGGVDLTLEPDANGGVVTVGALLGVTDSRVSFETSGDRVTIDGPSLGLHLAYANDSVRADLLIKRDFLDMEYRRSGPDAVAVRSNARSTGASLDFGVKLGKVGRLSVEAVGTLSHVATEIDAFNLGGADYGFGTALTTRGAFGLTVQGAYALGTTRVTPVRPSGIGPTLTAASPR